MGFVYIGNPQSVVGPNFFPTVDPPAAAAVDPIPGDVNGTNVTHVGNLVLVQVSCVVSPYFFGLRILSLLIWFEV